MSTSRQRKKYIAAICSPQSPPPSDRKSGTLPPLRPGAAFRSRRTQSGAGFSAGRQSPRPFGVVHRTGAEKRNHQSLLIQDKYVVFSKFPPYARQKSAGIPFRRPEEFSGKTCGRPYVDSLRLEIADWIGRRLSAGRGGVLRRHKKDLPSFYPEIVCGPPGTATAPAEIRPGDKNSFPPWRGTGFIGR